MDSVYHIAAIESLPMPPTLDGSIPTVALPLSPENQQLTGVNGFLEYTIKQKNDENARLQNENYALKYMIEQMNEGSMENQNAGLEDDGSKRAYEDEINRLNQLVAELAPFRPLVCKKLLSNGDQKNWHCYTTLDENENPSKLSMFNSTLFIDDIVSSKQLILEGAISQYDDDPFNGNAQGLCFGQLDVSYLLPKVLSCDVTELLLYNQNLRASEFEKLISSGLIKNLYLCNIQIYLLKFKQPVFTYLDMILEKLPNVERAAFLSMHCYSKETFKKLAKLPPFKKLKELKLDGISYPDFREDDFHGFMKKHPNTRISLSFITPGNARSIQSEFQGMKFILQSQAQHYNVNLEMEML